jgi:hypothetical protein
VSHFSNAIWKNQKAGAILVPRLLLPVFMLGTFFIPQLPFFLFISYSRIWHQRIFKQAPWFLLKAFFMEEAFHCLYHYEVEQKYPEDE